MIDRIRKHAVLSNYIVSECCEGGVSIFIEPDIGEYVILKVDDYYNDLNQEHRPPSPDCLIIQKCESGTFVLTIIELKGIKNSRGFDLDNLIAKFQTCLDDFVSNRFSDELLKDYLKLRLYFISNIDIYKRDIGLKLEALIEERFSYNGKNYSIDLRRPIPSLKKCY